jgi:hypothetical protein
LLLVLLYFRQSFVTDLAIVSVSCIAGAVRTLSASDEGSDIVIDVEMTSVAEMYNR